MTKPELQQSHEDVRQQLAERFNSVVELATRPEMDLRESGKSIAIYGGAQIAGNQIQIGSSSISYDRYDNHRTGYSLKSLGFQPEYAVTIIQRRAFFNTFIDRATFGVDENGTIIRGISSGHDMFGTRLRRELDIEESAALVDFITSPHLHLDKLGMVYRLTDEEKSKLEEQKLRIAEEQDEKKRRRGARIRVPGLTDHWR